MWVYIVLALRKSELKNIDKGWVRDREEGDEEEELERKRKLQPLVRTRQNSLARSNQSPITHANVFAIIIITIMALVLATAAAAAISSSSTLPASQHKQVLSFSITAKLIQTRHKTGSWLDSIWENEINIGLRTFRVVCLATIGWQYNTWYSANAHAQSHYCNDTITTNKGYLLFALRCFSLLELSIKLPFSYSNTIC